MIADEHYFARYYFLGRVWHRNDISIGMSRVALQLNTSDAIANSLKNSYG